MVFSAQKLQDISNFLPHEMKNTVDVKIFLEKEKNSWDEEEALLSPDAFLARPSFLSPSKSLPGKWGCSQNQIAKALRYQTKVSSSNSVM